MRRALLVLALVALVVAGGGVAAARTAPTLGAAGPVGVTGAEASVPFTVGERTVRQVRYVDRGTVGYTFRLTNDGRLPVTVAGLADQPDPRLFDLAGITRVEVPAGGSAEVTLTLSMNGCESLSSRSGSFVDRLRLRTTRAGVLDDEVEVVLPEELRTGSAREASCPEATATSRPQG